jgi:hypothetical protein
MGVPRTELVDRITGISRENTQSNNEDQSRGETQLGEGLWQRQNTEGNRFGNHN